MVSHLSTAYETGLAGFARRTYILNLEMRVLRLEAEVNILSTVSRHRAKVDFDTAVALRKRDNDIFDSHIKDDTFMQWFVDYLSNATLDDLKEEPIAWEDRTAYLQKKFEASRIVDK